MKFTQINKRTASISGYLFIIIFPLLIILANFQFLSQNKNFYFSLYDKIGVYGNFENNDEVIKATENLLGYYQSKNTLDQNFFSEQATVHLADVKELLKLTTGLSIISLLTTLLLAVLLLKRNPKILYRSALVSSLSTIAFTFLLSLGLLNSFNSLFTKFHQVTFNNQLWLFPEDDTLIKLSPPSFFVEFANRLARNILITSTLISIVSFLHLKTRWFRSK